MFRCKACEMNSTSKEKPNKVILERRDRVYKNKYGDIIGVGWEIVKEAFLCKRCKTNKEKLNGSEKSRVIYT